MTNPTLPDDSTISEESAPSTQEASIPLGVGGFAADGAAETFVAPGPARRIRSGSLILVLVVGLAAIGLFFMRALTRVTAAAAGHTQIETTIEAFLKAVSQKAAPNASRQGGAVIDPTRVLNVLSSDFTDRQVALSDVSRNPFIIYQLEARPTVASGVDPQGDIRRAIEQRRLLRLETISQVVGRLRLKSIILGSEPLASLGTQIVRVGDIIKVDDDTLRLRVKEIRKDSLILATEEPEIELTYESTLFLRPPQ